jgi:hypothetical protein
MAMVFLLHRKGYGPDSDWKLAALSTSIKQYSALIYSRQRRGITDKALSALNSAVVANRPILLPSVCQYSRARHRNEAHP